MKFNSKKSSVPLDRYISFVANRLGSGDFMEYIKFLEFNNVARPVEDLAIKIGDQELILDFFLGRSKDAREDIIMVNTEYESRVPESFIAIASINEVDFICLGKDAKIYYWDREKNDLYFDPNKKNKYLPQNKNLFMISSSFNGFIKNLYQYSDSGGDDCGAQNDYRNKTTPFSDESLDIYFKFPVLFFKQNEEAITIQLEKLLLSQKGTELLELFKEKGLLENL